MATAAIYARKSKATEKGESIENQIKRGEALCNLRGWDYVIYEDYDISGKTLERPGFEQMMKDAKAGKLDYIVCYKLDRISRSVNDFSSLIEELNSLGIGFICIKDNFDTTTPMGRAMMYITAVFAQLERETIAERVRDNMIDRAKMGKWNGGPIPYGFDIYKETVEYKGKNKKVSKLVINEDEANLIKQFYEWYLEQDGSIRNNVTIVNELGYKTKNGAPWSHNQMSRILQNPLYCIADQDAYEYFKNHTDVQIVNVKDEFDGSHGLMFYNRRKPHKKTSKQRPEDEWILVIGEHQGIIPGVKYKKVQMKLNSNKNKAPRQGQSERSPLIGLVKCRRCNSSMSIFSSPKNSKNKSQGYYHYFRCLTREQKAKLLCDNANIRADILEEIIIQHIKGLCNDKNVLDELLNRSNDEIESKRLPLLARRNKIQSELDSIDKEIDNLVTALGKGTLPELVIKKKYRELEEKKIELRKEYNKIDFELNTNYQETYNLEVIKEHLANFRDNYDYLSFDEKKKLLRSIVKEILVDRDKVKLVLYFLPGGDYQVNCLHTDMGVSAKCKTIIIECNINNVKTLPENTLGQRLKKLRLSNNMNIKELAKASKISEETISNIEKERVTNPNISTIKKLADSLNTTISYLMQLDNWPENTPGQIIKKYRIAKGLTQRELAKLCNLHYSTIKDYEDNRIKGNSETLELIYKVVGYKI